MEMQNFDLKQFTEVLDNCEGNVYMVTDEGDRLNLKSTLCQLIGFAKLIEGGTISKASVECDNDEDRKKLQRFNLFGDTNIK